MLNAQQVYTKYTGLTEKLLLELVFDEEKGTIKDSNGKIKTIFLYNDGTNPSKKYSSKSEEEKMWNGYFQKLRKLSKLEKII